MAAEYGGSAIQSLPIHERLVLSNMAIEMGGKAGIVEPNDRTARFLAATTGQSADAFETDLALDDGAAYESVHTYREEDLEPMISKPSNPENAVAVGDVAGVEIDQLFVGTCTNGRYEDIRIVADILDGERLAPDTRMVVVSASKSVYRRMIRTGVFETFVDAGAIVQSAGCGPCFGTHDGVLGEDDVYLATANRNFPGREGAMGSSVYLASPATVGASALYGEITDPRTVGTERYDDVVTTEGTA